MLTKLFPSTDGDFSKHTHTVYNIFFFVPSSIMQLCLAGLCAVSLRTWPPTVP